MPKEIRSQQVWSRITEKEEEKLIRLADRLNMTVSSYIQWLIQRAK